MPYPDPNPNPSPSPNPNPNPNPNQVRLVRALLDAAYRWGWLGGVQSMPDLGELQSDLDEAGEQAD